MVIGCIPYTVSADHMDFGSRAQIKVDDCPTGGWGTIQLEENKILKADDNTDLAKISSSQSVFNQFVYNRGRNYYDYASSNSKFAYDTKQSDYGAKIADGKYLYAVYDEGNSKGIYKVDFAAYFSSDLKNLIQKGDLEVAIVAEAKNYKGSTNKQRGIAQLRMYGNGSAIKHEITTDTNDYDGTRTVTAGWFKPSTEINRVMMNLRSERNKFTRKFNKSYVGKVRMFLRDTGAPNIKSCRISGGDFTSRTNVNGRTVYTAKVGSTIEYEVEFDEKVKVENGSNLKLHLKSKDDNKTFVAAFDRVGGGNKIYFKYTVPDNTGKNYELKVTADSARLENAKDCITDIAGNKLVNDSVSFTQTKGSNGAVHTVDDTYTGFAKYSFDDAARKPYGITSTLTKSEIVYGELPGGVYNTGVNQDTIFSENGSPKSTSRNIKRPIFRVLLDDEIQKKYLNGNTRLKLQVYDTNGNAVSGKYVYADLVCAGIRNINKNTTNGIKSDGYTELYFKYTPQKVSGYPIYKINFAGTKNSNIYTMDDDFITCSGSKLRNISDMEVSGKNLTVNLGQYGTQPPFNLGITIDTQAPELTENTISSEWAKAFKADTKLVFKDDGGFGEKGAYVSLVYYENGSKKILPVQVDSRIATNEINLATNKVTGSSNKVYVDLTKIKLSDSYKADYPLYLEYRISDKAGNTLTNAGQNNISVHLDNTAPVVTGVTHDESQKGQVTVKYNVTDTGVGKISPQIEYKLYNTSAGSKEEFKREDSTQSITVTGNQGKLDHWRIEAYFSDTVGNKMSASADSGPFTTALRKMVLNFNDSEESIVAVNHHITADTSKLPTEEVTFNVKYGWKRGSSATVSADAKTEVKFNSAAEFAKYDFCSDEIQRKYNSGNLFDGEFTFVVETVMMPDDVKQVHSQSFYFDKKAPEGIITVSKERTGVNQSYDILYDLYDDSSEYQNGAYVSQRNIDFSDGKAPVMNLYIDGELAKTYQLYTFKSKNTIDFKSEFGGDEKYENASTAKTEIVFYDKFGYKTTITGEEMTIDLKDPVIEAIEVDSESLLKRDEDLYIVNSLSDINSITAFMDDEAGDLLNVTSGARSTAKQTSPNLGYEVLVDNLVESDFQYRYNSDRRYDYKFDITDMGGNSTSRTVSFIVDYNPPYMYYTDLSPINKKTNAESVNLEIDYYADNYETNDDIQIEVSGPAEIADKSEVGNVTLRIKDNGTVKVTTRDAMGKTDEKTIEVNCFDRVLPVIELNTIEQKPENGPIKYGTMTMTASDNESLNVLGVAITAGTPTDNDFFTDRAETRVVSVSDDGTAEEVYTEGGYFGDTSGEAYATLTPANPVGATGNVSAGYKLSYGAIPDGTYGVYARVSDEVGNVTTVKLADITTTSETASAETEYTPNGERGDTGGDVTAKVTTDIRTRLLYGDSDNNIEAMKAHAAEMREKGYTYTYNGVTTTLSFEEAHEKYSEIAKKYLLNEEELTDEDRYLVKYSPTYENYDRYGGFLDSDLYIDPEGDLLDYLLNQCLYGTDYACTDDGYYVYFDVDTSGSPEASVQHTDDSYMEVIYPIQNSGIAEYIYKDRADSNPEPGVSPPLVAEDVSYRVDLGSYPEEIDNYSVPDIDKSELTPSEYETDEFENPFYGKSTVTTEELYEVFGTDFDLSLAEEVSDGVYKNPFGGYEDPYNYYYLTTEDIDETLLGYMTEYIEERTTYYENPFYVDGLNIYTRELTYEEIRQALNAVSKLQTLREQAADKAADKYVRSYVSMYGNVFALEHLMTFKDNVKRSYSLVDEAGRQTELPIEITWIDHSKPYVPKENIKFYIGDEVFESKYTNADSGKLEVMLPDDGIFAEYRLANLPYGAVGTDEEVTAGGVQVYRGFTLDVTENETIEFDVLNPTSSETEMSPQAYVVKCFDRNAPTYELMYSPQKPSNGADVNRDVTVSLTEIRDDFSGRDDITVSAESYTFTENGKYTFTLTDEAGNMAKIPVEVDYIDKTPTDLTLKFKSGEKELDTDENFTVTTNDGDYRSVSSKYEYKGTYLKDDVTALVYFRGEMIQSITVSDDSEYSYTYTRSNGSKADVSISGIKFDKEPPTAEVTYTYIAATSGAKDAVRADIALADNISGVTLVSASGSDDGGKKFTETDVTTNADGTKSVMFNNNGNASLVFTDASGNTTEVGLNVTNLDRTAPRAFISYSSETATNSDVIANISLSKHADYRVYNESGKLLKDYSGALSSYITYTFEDNGTRVFQFRDAAGNETEGLLATVNNIDKEKPQLSAAIEYNKMVTDEGTLEYYPGAATIVLNVESTGDILNGGDDDTIFIQNASQSRYHSVLSNGQYTFRYMDNAGNFDILYVNVDGIDTTLPTATTMGNPTVWTNVAPEITITANKKASGMKSYIYQNGVKTEKTTLTPTQNGTYTYTVMDEIGNSATHKVVVDHVDTVYPEITINTANTYNGNRDIYISAGEFDKAAFEDVTAYDGDSGLASSNVTIDYGDFDQNVPGEYSVYFKISDVAGNETVLTRKILVMGPDDVYAAINDQLIIPGSQANYWLGEELTLSFVNAETAGNKVSYAFEKGYYNGAQLKGKSFKSLANPTDKIKLEADETGMYTLFLQTENRKVMVMYVFISG